MKWVKNLLACIHVRGSTSKFADSTAQIGVWVCRQLQLQVWKHNRNQVMSRAGFPVPETMPEDSTVWALQMHSNLPCWRLWPLCQSWEPDLPLRQGTFCCPNLRMFC